MVESTSLKTGSYSAIVEMDLLVGDRTLRIVQLGPDFAYLESPVEIPPNSAVLRFSVDGMARSWLVRLPDGISASDCLVRLAPA
jgi:hypothetical protein